MSAKDTFSLTGGLSERLRKLRVDRGVTKAENRGNKRAPLSKIQKENISQKTKKHCHICGGELGKQWQADHVVAHSRRGEHDEGNYLPACSICNGYRKGYDPEEIQWILKLGVWIRTQIQTGTPLGVVAETAFCKYDTRRAARSGKSTT